MSDTQGWEEMDAAVEFMDGMRADDEEREERALRLKIHQARVDAFENGPTRLGFFEGVIMDKQSAEVLDEAMYLNPGMNSPVVEVETVYTAYALTKRGREEIECYGTGVDALRDMLELWPEDDEGDVVIEDNHGHAFAYFARSDSDPRIVHVYFMGDDMKWVDRVESYRCEYEPALGGSVRTNIKRLG
jgi:hypothetical protein